MLGTFWAKSSCREETNKQLGCVRASPSETVAAVAPDFKWKKISP